MPTAAADEVSENLERGEELEDAPRPAKAARRLGRQWSQHSPNFRASEQLHLNPFNPLSRTRRSAAHPLPHYASSKGDNPSLLIGESRRRTSCSAGAGSSTNFLLDHTRDTLGGSSSPQLQLLSALNSSFVERSSFVHTGDRSSATPNSRHNATPGGSGARGAAGGTAGGPPSSSFAPAGGGVLIGTPSSAHSGHGLIAGGATSCVQLPSPGQLQRSFDRRLQDLDRTFGLQIQRLIDELGQAPKSFAVEQKKLIESQIMFLRNVRQDLLTQPVGAHGGAGARGGSSANAGSVTRSPAREGKTPEKYTPESSCGLGGEMGIMGQRRAVVARVETAIDSAAPRSRSDEEPTFCEEKQFFCLIPFHSRAGLASQHSLQNGLDKFFPSTGQAAARTQEKDAQSCPSPRNLESVLQNDSSSAVKKGAEESREGQAHAQVRV